MTKRLEKVNTEDSGAYHFHDDGAPEHHSYNLPKIKSFIPEGKHKIMDAGCGCGQVSNWLAELGHEAWGCDPSQSGIELARKSYPNADFFVADLMDGSPVKDENDRFDGIVSVEVMEHLYDPERVLKNLYSAIKPGGWIILTTPYHGYLKNLTLSLVGGWDEHFMVNSPGGHIKFFSHRTMTDMLTDTGFTDVAIKGAGRLPLLQCSMVVFARKPFLN